MIEFIRFIWILQQTVTFDLSLINRLVFITEGEFLLRGPQ